MLSNISYPKLNQVNSLRSFRILSCHLRPGLPTGVFPVGVPVKILKALHSGYMTCPFPSSRLNRPDCIRRTVQTVKFLIVKPSSLPIWAQIFASRSWWLSVLCKNELKDKKKKTQFTAVNIFNRLQHRIWAVQYRLSLIALLFRLSSYLEIMLCYKARLLYKQTDKHCCHV